MLMSTRASVEMYLCAFHLGKWEPDESVEDAYHRALNITPDQFHDMRKDDDGIREKHADAIHRMYEVAGVNLFSEYSLAALRAPPFDCRLVLSDIDCGQTAIKSGTTEVQGTGP
jgi:hypothetical protein